MSKESQAEKWVCWNVEMDHVAHAQAKGQTFHTQAASECKSKLTLQKNLQLPHVVAPQDSKEPVGT